MYMSTTTFLPPVKAALEKFPQVFQGEDEVLYAGPLGAAWAPGRVNIIGEHTDYNDGYVLPLAVDRVSAFAGRTRTDRTVRLWSAHFHEYAQFTLAGLPESFEEQRGKLPGWARYVLGVATELARAGVTLKGFSAVVAGDVPLGGGMSFSVRSTGSRNCTGFLILLKEWFYHRRGECDAWTFEGCGALSGGGAQSFWFAIWHSGSGRLLPGFAGQGRAA